jgi:hypothetical protein
LLIVDGWIPGQPGRARLTALNCPVARSFTYTSGLPFLSSGTKAKVELKTTKRPSDVIRAS